MSLGLQIPCDLPRAGLRPDQRIQETAEKRLLDHCTCRQIHLCNLACTVKESFKYMMRPAPTHYPVLVNVRLTDKELKFREVKDKISEQESGRARTET